MPGLEFRALTVRTNDQEIVVRLTMGDTPRLPISYSQRLLEATPQQRRNCQVIDEGKTLRWPAIDEDLSVDTFVRDARGR